MAPTGRQNAVTQMLDRAAALARGRPGAEEVVEFLAELDALKLDDYISLDGRARTWSAGLLASEIAALRRRLRRAKPARRLWSVLALMSADGRERERAIAAVELRRSTVALLVIRSTDWVPEVREAALRRLGDVYGWLLRETLPLAEALTGGRSRAAALAEAVDDLLTDDELRAGTRSAQEGVRRSAWRRLRARGVCTTDELRTRALHDPDPLVRDIAADALPGLGDDDRRAIAETLFADPVGRLATRGLATLVELDGEAAIRRALVAPSRTLQRQGRLWAAVHGVDARAVHHERLEAEPGDELALIAVAEIRDPRDEGLIAGALRDPRARVRVAALAGLAGLDAAAAREAALAELEAAESGRMTRTAAAVLRRAALRDDDLDRIEAVALDDGRRAGQRLRAIALMRRSRWRHLAAVLDARDAAPPELRTRLDHEIGVWLGQSGHLRRRPADPLRQRIVAALPALDSERRAQVDFILRTTL